MLAGHFIDSPQGHLFITQFGELTITKAILCLPSITEELNLARAVCAKQAEAFAEAGTPCVILDYLGTGDSEQEFDQVDCHVWLDNIITTGKWLMAQGVSEIVIFGVRFGALLALANQQKLHQALPICQQIYWKPVLNGKQFSGQFLRIKQAREMITSGNNKINWREKVLNGEELEVAGYPLTASMLTSMEQLQVKPDDTLLSPVHWFELAATEASPLIKKFIISWQSQVKFSFINCPAFWQVPEIFTLPELYQPTLDCLITENLC